MIESRVKFDKVFEDGIPVQYIPYFLYVGAVLIFYIGNTHYADRTVRQTQKLKTEVNDLRADYTTLKADLMFASKQSEVARKVKPYGLKESLTPPYKVVIEEGEY